MAVHDALLNIHLAVQRTPVAQLVRIKLVVEIFKLSTKHSAQDNFRKFARALFSARPGWISRCGFNLLIFVVFELLQRSDSVKNLAINLPDEGKRLAFWRA